jgi:hypothetical protein
MTLAAYIQMERKEEIKSPEWINKIISLGKMEKDKEGFSPSKADPQPYNETNNSNC